MEIDETLATLSKWKSESEDMRRKYDYRWSKNIKLYKGIFRDTEKSVSKIRNREKIFFRKIWATIWRLVASMYYAFLKDPDNFKIEGRDFMDDPAKASILQKLVEYRRDRMMRHDSLFLKFIWAFQNIFSHGWTCGKMMWDYKEDGKTDIPLKDEPRFILYPNEQVYPDMTAETKEDMRYIHFLNYMTKDDMEGYEFENIKQCQPASVDSNVVRQTRHMQTGDPLQNPGENEYPSPGRYQDDMKDKHIKRYNVFESFWKEDGRMKYAVSNDFKVWLKQPKISPYGDEYDNIIMGTCLTEAHKLFGEGFPEPLEAPQESYNYNLNMRKDNVALAMTGHTFVSRFGNVDLQSLLNRRAGGYTLMDDISAVQHEQMPDVTQSSYIEASADDAMMQEISGVTAGKVGMESAEKATVAQINFTESNAKVDLYIAIVGETFVKEFFVCLARMVQRFENDWTVFRIANERFKKEAKVNYQEDIYDIDFEADCIINVGMGTVGRDMEIKQTLLAMDRAIMTMQAASGLAKIGAVPKDGIKIPNVSKFFETLLPKIGYKNVNDFFITIPPPPQVQPGVGGSNPALAGSIQPQIGNMNIPAEAEMVQGGGNGG